MEASSYFTEKDIIEKNRKKWIIALLVGVILVLPYLIVTVMQLPDSNVLRTILKIFFSIGIVVLIQMILLFLFSMIALSYIILFMEEVLAAIILIMEHKYCIKGFAVLEVLSFFLVFLFVLEEVQGMIWEKLIYAKEEIIDNEIYQIQTEYEKKIRSVGDYNQTLRMYIEQREKAQSWKKFHDPYKNLEMIDDKVEYNWGKNRPSYDVDMFYGLEGLLLGGAYLGKLLIQINKYIENLREENTAIQTENKYIRERIKTLESASESIKQINKEVEESNESESQDAVIQGFEQMTRMVDNFYDGDKKNRKLFKKLINKNEKKRKKKYEKK